MLNKLRSLFMTSTENTSAVSSNGPQPYIQEEQLIFINDLEKAKFITEEEKEKILSGDFAIHEIIPDGALETISWALGDGLFIQELSDTPSPIKWPIIKYPRQKILDRLVFPDIKVSDVILAGQSQHISIEI